MQRSDFPLKGRQPAQVAHDWWQQIQRDMHVAELDQAICDGEDMTETIKEMDR